MPVHRCLTVSQGGVGGLLREAAATGQLSLLKELLRNKVSVFEVDAQASSALHRAASAGQGDACRLLCSAGAVGFATNAQNLSAYDLAVQHQHNDVRRVFQPSAADRDIEEARLNGNNTNFESEHVEWKLESEPPFVTPLMRAARLGNLDDVNRLILNEGIKQLHMRSKRRCSALLMAAEGGHVEVMTALFESKRKAGLDVDASAHQHFTVDDADADGCTALHLTAANGHLLALNKLLSQEPALDKRTKLGETPLYIAARNGYDSVVSHLLKAKANATVANANEITPLMAAASNGMAKVVELLLENAGSEEDQQKLLISSGSETSPLHRAAQGGHAKVVRMLLRATVDTSPKTLSGVRSRLLPIHSLPHNTRDLF